MKIQQKSSNYWKSKDFNPGMGLVRLQSSHQDTAAILAHFSLLHWQQQIHLLHRWKSPYPHGVKHKPFIHLESTDPRALQWIFRQIHDFGVKESLANLVSTSSAQNEELVSIELQPTSTPQKFMPQSIHLVRDFHISDSGCFQSSPVSSFRFKSLKNSKRWLQTKEK